LNLNKKFIAYQIRGSKQCKEFPYNQTKAIVNKLVELGYIVCLIDKDPEIGWEVPGKVINFCGQLDESELLALVHCCDYVVCWDSAVLWMAHTQYKPTIIFMGPTKDRERLGLHPSKCYKIDCAKAVGCSPCVETYSMCKVNGIPTFTCAKKVPLKFLLQEIDNGVKYIRGN